MSLKCSPKKQQDIDAEWLRECINFINNNSHDQNYELVNRIFVETYYENLRQGMNPKDALQKAKWVAFCFLMQKK